MLLPEPFAAEHDEHLRRYCQNPGSSAILGRVREMILRDRDERLVHVALKAIDLGQTQQGDEPGERFFGAFLTDLRMRKALETENQTLLARLEQEALIDPLTGLPNRRAFDAEAVRAMARLRGTARRRCSPSSTSTTSIRSTPISAMPPAMPC